MFRKFLLPVLSSLLVLMYFSTSATYAKTTSDWSNTATHAIQLKNATLLGPLKESKKLSVLVSLNLRNQKDLQQYIQNISTKNNPLYGKSLSSSEFKLQYGPTDQQVKNVTQYLKSNGLKVTNVASNNLLISATGKVNQIENAFHTKINRFQQNNHTVYVNTKAAQVPQSLSDTVKAVLGLNNVAQLATAYKLKSQSSPNPSISTPNYPASYNPQDFWKAYDVGSTSTGQNTNTAIFAEGDLTQVVQNLRTEENANNLPQVPVSIIHTGAASTDTSGAEEWDMDTQYSTGMAKNVSNLDLYDAPSMSNADITSEFNQFVTQNSAKAGSASFGECSILAYATGMTASDDEIFAQAAAQGQSIFASAGDTGGFCTVAPTNGVPAGIPDVEYPAASQYVTAVGGTTLLTNNDGSYNNELAWLAGGGGPSYFESEPAWQQGIVAASTGKGIPDVSMDADPYSGAVVYTGSSSTATVGGTSLASPLALGVWTRLESSHSNNLGFASPLLYQAYQSKGFHDITLGDNGPYPATPGWDFATGLGTFDVTQMNAVIAP